MINRVFLTAAVILMAMAIACTAAETPRQSALDPARAETSRKYPQIVLYSVVWCPHCREAKEYLTKNEIPFINRDVEQDAGAMRELTGKYDSNGVPVIVFGNGKNEIVMRGFSPELFQENLKKALLKK
ncbi:MAG: glutaredoxin domain-containing protein [Geobacteraceae bacterium]|nr:glutaredoxin domain-containing protein [Geobacteraceae bacterium]